MKEGRIFRHSLGLCHTLPSTGLLLVTVHGGLILATFGGSRDLWRLWAIVLVKAKLLCRFTLIFD